MADQVHGPLPFAGLSQGTCQTHGEQHPYPAGEVAGEDVFAQVPGFPGNAEMSILHGQLGQGEQFRVVGVCRTGGQCRFHGQCPGQVLLVGVVGQPAGDLECLGCRGGHLPVAVCTGEGLS